MITYEQLDAVIPRVPAGINSGDLTDPDERPAFVAQVLGWVMRAESSQTAPGSPESYEQGSYAPTVPENGRGENNGLSSCGVAWGVDRAEVTWGPPDPGSRCYQHCTHWTEAGEECCDCKRIISEHELFMPWCPGKQENAR